MAVTAAELAVPEPADGALGPAVCAVEDFEASCFSPSVLWRPDWGLPAACPGSVLEGLTVGACVPALVLPAG
jgi:hypothetical protein